MFLKSDSKYGQSASNTLRKTPIFVFYPVSEYLHNTFVILSLTVAQIRSG